MFEDMKINSVSPDRDIFKKIGDVIRKGGVILYPTDTVYGLGCDPFSCDAVERILALKGRVPDKGVLVLIPSYEWLFRIAGEVSQGRLDLCRSWWPGPVTCLFEAAPELPEILTGTGGKIGVRMPDSKFLLGCMNSTPGPLVSTSANFAGEPPASRFSAVNSRILEGVDLSIEDTLDSMSERKASTVVDLSGDKPLIIREGEGIERVLHSGISR